MRNVLPAVLACMVVLLLTGCGMQPMGGSASTSTSAEQANPVYPSLTFTTAPSEQPVDVLLDAQGQPYDTTTHGASFRWLSIGGLTSPSGRIGITDGNLGCCADGYWQLAGHGRYEVRVAWAAYPTASSTGSTPEPTEPPVTTSTTAASEPELQTAAAPQASDASGRPVGTMVSVPGATVARWGPYRGGYLTDGGQGAFHTEELATSPEILDDRVWDWLDDGYSFDYRLGDLDGVPGEDLVVFDNGMGDGTFPLIVGYDASEQVLALVTWSDVYPWRLAFPDGTPPQDVLDREKSISDCLAEHGRPADDGCAL